MKVFDSPWQAGFEGADHVNRQGLKLSMNQLTGHSSRAPQDYAELKALQITIVRESVGWRLVEQRGRFDFSSLHSRLEAARRLDIQICWTFCHYGWPEDIDIFSDQFVPRFARFCGALAAWLAPYYDRAPVYSPMNEPAGGLAIQLFHCRQGAIDDVGREGKRQLVRAALGGCDAIWAADPRARLLHCDPLIHLIATPGGVDIAGICLYPAIDRSDWEDIHHWHHSGLWDVVPNVADPLARTLCQLYATALLRVQRKLDHFQMLFSSHCPPGQDKTMQTIIVFSHLSWDFVWQRPQHLLSRLAQHFAVIFVEEPVYSPGAARMEITAPAANVSVWRPHTPVQAAVGCIKPHWA